ncbi:hypothetical protein AHF37_02645 [Paragonimus kellicotti]|nr:hypothetical protein AHF37_02645 [Paragonimus kellicotti]
MYFFFHRERITLGMYYSLNTSSFNRITHFRFLQTVIVNLQKVTTLSKWT